MVSPLLHKQCAFLVSECLTMRDNLRLRSLSRVLSAKDLVEGPSPQGFAEVDACIGGNRESARATLRMLGRLPREPPFGGTWASAHGTAIVACTRSYDGWVTKAALELLPTLEALDALEPGALAHAAVDVLDVWRGSGVCAAGERHVARESALCCLLRSSPAVLRQCSASPRLRASIVRLLHDATIQRTLVRELVVKMHGADPHMTEVRAVTKANAKEGMRADESAAGWRSAPRAVGRSLGSTDAGIDDDPPPLACSTVAAPTSTAPRGCVRCGCSQEWDGGGERVCWCAACVSSGGCVYDERLGVVAEGNSTLQPRRRSRRPHGPCGLARAAVRLQAAQHHHGPRQQHNGHHNGESPAGDGGSAIANSGSPHTRTNALKSVVRCFSGVRRRVCAFFCGPYATRPEHDHPRLQHPSPSLTHSHGL